MALATSTGTTSISAPNAPAASYCFDGLEDLHGRFGSLADRLEAAGPGGARRDQADMADDRDIVVGEALDRRNSRPMQ